MESPPMLSEGFKSRHCGTLRGPGGDGISPLPGLGPALEECPYVIHRNAYNMLLMPYGLMRDKIRTVIRITPLEFRSKLRTFAVGTLLRIVHDVVMRYIKDHVPVPAKPGGGWRSHGTPPYGTSFEAGRAILGWLEILINFLRPLPSPVCRLRVDPMRALCYKYIK